MTKRTKEHVEAFAIYAMHLSVQNLCMFEEEEMTRTKVSQKMSGKHLKDTFNSLLRR
jgi:hypothetical protein